MRAVLIVVALAWAAWVVYLLSSAHSWMPGSELVVEPPADVQTTTTTLPPQGQRPLLPPPQGEDQPDRSARVQVVFSTDCSAYQDWQSEVVFNSASLARHRGPLTRIASGCSADDRARLLRRYKALYDDDDDLFEPRVSVHFTPSFDRDADSGKTYSFYNKPRGIEHWLKEGGAKNSSSPQREIIALIDPDFVFLKPLSDELEYPIVRHPWKPSELPYRRVERGRPVGQQYGLGAQWISFDREFICGAGSPCLDVDRQEANQYYPVGPPYVLHRDDWTRLAPVWRDFAPRVYKQYPHLLAEMYAYCAAAAHLRLRHLRVNHMMLSNVAAGDEAWDRVDKRRTDDLLLAPSKSSSLKLRQLPNFIHYCQNYRLGDFMFAKRRVPPSMFVDCDHPLLAEPPPNASKVGYELQPPGNPCREDAKKKPLTNQLLKDRTFLMMKAATVHVNAAATKARAKFCNGTNAPPPVKLFDLAMRCRPRDGRGKRRRRRR
mmetsp:Transcript_23696/g.76100  ORF Transcript_23696/g.76100 Transcript_23696/m.76100 type:complete len:489 (+) Transcript_23696:93-1559(+)